MGPKSQKIYLQSRTFEISMPKIRISRFFEVKKILFSRKFISRNVHQVCVGSSDKLTRQSRYPTNNRSRLPEVPFLND